VSDAFHARHSAKWRAYRYYLSMRATAIGRDFAWYVGGYQIDRGMLQECAAVVLGERDFSSFCKSNSSTEDFRCRVERSEWTEVGSNLIYEIRSNRFLYGMVRTLVGTMVEVARGHRELGTFSEILKAKDRSRAGMAAPAKGLFLEGIGY
jgi:tRNA pseudouridine38-40 synthase